MSTDKRLPTLPQETAEQLVALRGTSPEEFYALVTALRVEGWPLRAIAEPFAVSRTTASVWATKHNPLNPLPSVPEMPVLPVEDRSKGAKKIILTDEQANRLRELSQMATNVRRNTYEQSPERLAAQELEFLLLEYSSNGVTRVDLAAACGVSDSSIKQRLRKYR